MRPKQRAKASNSNLLVGTDGRSARARRYRDILHGFTAEFDSATLSDGARTLLAQAAAMSLQAESLTAQAVRGDLINNAELADLCSTVRNLLAAVRAGHVADLRHASV